MIITFSNLSGGSGRTTVTSLFAYLLEKKNKKVLCIDLASLADLTKILFKTFRKEQDNNKNIFKALLAEDDICNYIEPLSNNLDIISGSWDMVNFQREATKIYNKESLHQILKYRIKNAISSYDFILIDSEHSGKLLLDNSIFASDKIIITTRTNPTSYNSTDRFHDYLYSIYKDSPHYFEILGILLHVEGTSTIDKELEIKYQEEYSEYLLNNTIKYSTRIPIWHDKGITNNDFYDKGNLMMYLDVVNEVLEKY